MDFLWLLKGDEISDDVCQVLIQSVKKINGIQMIAELTNEQIKTRATLYFNFFVAGFCISWRRLLRRTLQHNIINEQINQGLRFNRTRLILLFNIANT